jgi:hypothetical protein
MVAREGSAPSISGCRPDVILFHHRAKRREKEECRMKKRTQHFLERLGSLGYFAFRSSKWYARPVTLRNPALI